MVAGSYIYIYNRSHTGDGVGVVVFGKVSKFRLEMMDNHVFTRCFSASSVVGEVIRRRFSADYSASVNISITDDTLFLVVSATIIIEVLRLITPN